jgi:uncharacterized protein
VDQELVVTLARLRDAAELYRQLAQARRDLTQGLDRAADLEALADEYSSDLSLAQHHDRQQQAESRRLEDALASLEARLQDRRARHPHDAGTLLALNDEIASLQRRRDDLERQLLELWQRDDTTAAALAAETAETAGVRERLGRRCAELQVRSERAARAVPEITAELEHLGKLLPRRVAGRLDQIARRHADPVADLLQGACAGCGLSLPLQEAVDADREAALIACRGCGRYIVPRSSRKTRG